MAEDEVIPFQETPQGRIVLCSYCLPKVQKPAVQAYQGDSKVEKEKVVSEFRGICAQHLIEVFDAALRPKIVIPDGIGKNIQDIQVGDDEGTIIGGRAKRGSKK